MYLKVKQSVRLQGKATPPGSKSQSIRGLFFALLAEGESILNNVLDSEDTRHAIQVCKNLGATIRIHDNQIILQSTGIPIEPAVTTLHTGNSGITTRFVMPLLGFCKNPLQSVIVDCDEQMRARPIGSLVTALTQLGLIIEYLNNHGSLPISISGHLKGGTAEIDGLTSQFLSALLISLPCADADSKIIVKNLHERPYVEMTLDWLKRQNIQYTHQRNKENDVFFIQGQQKYKNMNTTIAGDFSSASYLIAAAALTEGCVELTGLNMQDPQGDKRLVSLLQKMGADISIHPTSLVIHGCKPLKGIQIDANDIPDLLPTLAVIGTYASGKTSIDNVAQARIKETDRIHSMSEGLTLMGAKVEEHKDGLTVYQSSLCGARVKGYGDHRTVMALSVAGLIAKGVTLIEESEAIHKTYPHYVNTMKLLGAHMEETNDINH